MSRNVVTACQEDALRRLAAGPVRALEATGYEGRTYRELVRRGLAVYVHGEGWQWEATITGRTLVTPLGAPLGGRQDPLCVHPGERVAPEPDAAGRVRCACGAAWYPLSSYQRRALARAELRRLANAAERRASS